MTTVRPYLERLVLGRDSDWASVAATAAKDLGLAVIALPGDLRRLVTRAERGELEVRVPGVERSRFPRRLRHAIMRSQPHQRVTRRRPN